MNTTAIHPRSAVRWTHDADLAARTSLRVPARAAWLAEVADVATLPEVLADPRIAEGELLVLGGGSNLLFATDLDGVALALTCAAVSVVADDGDAVAAADVERLQDGGEGVHLAQQIAIAQLARGTGLRGNRHQRKLVAACLDVTVDGVVAEVGFAPDEPPAEWRVRIIEDGIGRPVPVDGTGLLGPERFGLFDRAAVEFFVAHGDLQGHPGG